MENFIPAFFISLIAFMLGFGMVLSIEQESFKTNNESSSYYREGYCKALNGDRIEGKLCVDKDNNTLYIFNY